MCQFTSLLTEHFDYETIPPSVTYCLVLQLVGVPQPGQENQRVFVDWILFPAIMVTQLQLVGE